jgi:hypothetical protein
MIYAFQKFRHYLVGGHFKFFTNHSTQKNLVNNHALEGRIYIWLLLFYKFSFEVIVKLGKLYVGPDHLSILELGESCGFAYDHLVDVNCFKIKDIPDYLYDISLFLTIGTIPDGYLKTQKRHLVVHAAEYHLIVG